MLLGHVTLVRTAILAPWKIKGTLQWRHNKRGGFSNRRRLDCSPKRLFMRRSNKHHSSASLALWDELMSSPIHAGIKVKPWSQMPGHSTPCTRLQVEPSESYWGDISFLLASEWKSSGQLGSLLLTWLTYIPALISNQIPSEVWDGITYPFPNFNSATVETREWISNFISHFIEHVITYPCWGLS